MKHESLRRLLVLGLIVPGAIAVGLVCLFVWLLPTTWLP